MASDLDRTPMAWLRRYEFNARVHGDRTSLKLTAEEALQVVPDGWAKIDGQWVEVERCDTDCSEHYDGHHLSIAPRYWAGCGHERGADQNQGESDGG